MPRVGATALETMPKSPWLKVPLALLLAHICGALAFPVALSLTAATRFPADEVTGGQVPLSLDWWLTTFKPLILILIAFSSALFFFQFVAVLMLPLTILTAPLTISAAVLLRSGRRLTTVYGALAGLLIGGPWARAAHGLELWDGTALFGLGAGGAAFAQPLWALCIRHRVAPRNTERLGRVRAWWKRRSLGAKVLMCVACAVAVLFSI